MDTPDRIITELNESDYNYLYKIQNESATDVNSRYEFIFQRHPAANEEPVSFGWCMRRSYDCTGKFTDKIHFEMRVKALTPDSLNNFPIFVWSDIRDFGNNHHTFKLTVKKRITIMSAVEVEAAFKDDLKELCAKYEAKICINTPIAVAIPKIIRNNGHYISESAKFEITEF